jgi:3-deoxy-D-manno-octulosonate 8-phosphate phosphatase (KDO 8-P phosphatase)
MSIYQRNLQFLLQKHQRSVADLSAQNALKDAMNPTADELPRIADAFLITTDLLLRVNIEEREKQRAKDIKLVVFDIDGVLTDAGIYYTESGDEIKKFNAKDGLMIRRLNKAGITTGIISHGMTSKLIATRAERLYIPRVEVSSVPKMETMKKWCEELGIGLENVCFIGDDINDEELMRSVGFSACPADAVDAIKNLATVVLTKKGGEGCVRELIDGYLDVRPLDFRH